MYFSGSARLSDSFPEVGDLPARLDELLRDLGGGALLEPEALASELGESKEQVERVLALAAANVLAGAGGSKCAFSVDAIGLRILEAINQP
jgi:hypothetical protein